MEPTIGVTSTYPFFGGEKVLILIAPDHPEAPIDRRRQTPYWEIEVADNEGETHATRGSHGDTAESLWLQTSSALYQAVSSTEVDRLYNQLQDWVSQVHAAYHARIATTA